MDNNSLKQIQGDFSGERALFMMSGAHIKNSLFFDGESPLKHSSNLEIENTTFDWKYPLWYSKNINVNNTIFTQNSRAGIWYTDNIIVKNSTIDAPKCFRRCNGITLDNVKFTDAKETLWTCNDVKIINSVSNESYFGMNTKNVYIDNFTLDGNYAFDGAENLKIYNSKFLTKDAFWNSKNVYIENSYISGEYFAWNSENVTLVNCTVSSLQGFCFIKNLKLVNCILEGTSLAFEYSSVDAKVIGKVDSIKNPLCGRIECDSVSELIMEDDKVDTSKTTLVIKDRI